MSSAANEGYAGTERAGRMRTKASEAMGEAADQIKQQGAAYMDAARRSAEDMAERTTELGRQASNSVQDVAANFRQAVERSVEQQPLTTVLLAVAAGVVLGGLMRR